MSNLQKLMIDHYDVYGKDAFADTLAEYEENYPDYYTQ